MDLRFSAGQSPNPLRRSYSSAAHIYLCLSTHARGYERNYNYSWAHAGICCIMNLRVNKTALSDKHVLNILLVLI
jgi:hypothetical protein